MNNVSATGIRLSAAIKWHNDNIRRPNEKKVTKRSLSKLIKTLNIQDKTIFEYLSRYESGTRECPDGVVAELSKLLFVSKEFLTGDDDKPIPDGQAVTIIITA
jgi:hypothetical protein